MANQANRQFTRTKRANEDVSCDDLNLSNFASMVGERDTASKLMEETWLVALEVPITISSSRNPIIVIVDACTISLGAT